jgi:hypothetical protein
MRVELLFRDGDPRLMDVRQRLVEVLTEDAFETPIQLVALVDEADALALDVHGSPTIRIDGLDIAPLDGPATLADRAFPPDDDPGGPSSEPLPGRDLIRTAVERARGWSHGRRPSADEA